MAEANIKNLLDAQAKIVYPVTHERAVIDSSGNTLESKIEQVAYISSGETTSTVMPSFDAYTDTVHLTEQALSSGATAQARKNIGAAASNGRDAEDVSGYTDDIVRYTEQSARTETEKTIARENIGAVSMGEVEDYVSGYTASALTDIESDLTNLETEVNEIMPGIFDVTKYSGVTFNTLSDALQAVPQDYRRGGMSIKYVQTSDNKYVQYRLMTDSFNTTVANWQGEDISVSINNIVLPEWVNGNQYVLGNQVQYTNGGVTKYYRCKADTDSAPLTDTDYWAEMTFYSGGPSIQSVNIGNESNPIYQNCIEIKAMAGSNIMNYLTTEDDIGYVTTSHYLIIRKGEYGRYFPFLKGAIYTYHGRLYSWNGNDLTVITNDSLINLSGIGTFSPEICPNIGDVFFNTTMNLLRRRLAPIPSLDFETVPFIDGAIYTYNEELYIWNGTSLVKKTSYKTPEVSENTDNTDFGISDYNGNVIISLSEGHIRTQKFDSSKLVQKLKILLIGNSYSADSFAYVPFILKNYGIDIEIGIYLRGGASLQNHIDEWQSGSWPFFYIDSAKDNKWTTISQYYNPKLSVQYTDWNIIVLQQGSVYSLSWNNFEPQARNLITLITSVLDKPIKLGWNININRKTTDAAIQTEQTSILTNIQDCVNREPINIIFPYGTAIFNSRTNTTIKDISNGGNMWAEDEIHLQEGLPCYIAALANIQALFNMYYPKYSVVNDNTLITDALIESWDVPQPHGSVVGMTSSNRILAQTCAILSNNKPFEITNIY